MSPNAHAYTNTTTTNCPHGEPCSIARARGAVKRLLGNRRVLGRVSDHNKQRGGPRTQHWRTLCIEHIIVFSSSVWQGPKRTQLNGGFSVFSMHHWERMLVVGVVVFRDFCKVISFPRTAPCYCGRALRAIKQQIMNLIENEG